MSQFSAPRLWRVMQNDALRILLPLLSITVVYLALTVLIYLSLFKAGNTQSPPASAVMFGIFMMLGGLQLTIAAFGDLRRPLECSRYLMLPCSNLERFLGRYLLTGPLFLLYAMATFAAVDWVANLLTEKWLGLHAAPFAPFSPLSLVLMRVYLFAHIVVLPFVISCRSWARIRTTLLLPLAIAGFTLVAYLSMRIFYWDHFSWTRLAPLEPFDLPLLPLFATTWMNFVVAIGFLLWMLRVAYRYLCGHEVQDGL